MINICEVCSYHTENAQRHVHRTQSYTHSIVRHAYSIQRYAHCVEYPGMYAHIGFVRNALTIQRHAATSIMLTASRYCILYNF